MSCALCVFVAAGLLGGCAQVPDLPSSRIDSEDRFATAPWPELIAFDQTIGTDPEALDNPGPALLARAQVLRRRAAQLQTSIFTEDDLARIEASIALRKAISTN